jgi:serine/threonine-protein kinase
MSMNQNAGLTQTGLQAGGWTDPSAAPSLKRGQLVAGRYRVVRALAQGGQAMVYLGEQEPLGRPVALKVMIPPPQARGARQAAWAQRFILEAKTLAALEHPHIVRIYDYGEVGDGSLYIAMEYLKGRAIDEVLPPGGAAAEEVLAQCHQVCSALSFAHKRGVIHGTSSAPTSWSAMTRAENG